MPTTPDVDSLTGRDPEVIRLCARILRQTMWPYHRAEVRGLERVPKEGRLLYVGNHNGYPYMEELWLFLCGLYHEYGMQRFPFVAMHPFSINLPLLGPFFVRCGAIRASSQNAASVLEAGHPLMIFPGGHEELMRPHRDRAKLQFGAKGRTSYVRMALRADAPVVPIAAVGGHSSAIILDDMPWLAKVLGADEHLGVNRWPAMLSFPWGLTVGPFIPPYIPWPGKIIVEVLEPIVFERTGVEAARDIGWVNECADRVEQALSSAITRLERERVEQHALLPKVLSAAARGVSRLLELSEDTSQPDPPPPPLQSDEPPSAMDFRDIGSLFPGDRVPRRRTRAEIQQVLDDAEIYVSVAALCRDHGISTSTFYAWRERYGARESTAGTAKKKPTTAKKRATKKTASKKKAASKKKGAAKKVSKKAASKKAASKKVASKKAASKKASKKAASKKAASKKTASKKAAKKVRAKR